MAGQPAQAVTAPIAVTKCGQVIDRDAYLARDLKCDTEFGIVLRQLDLTQPLPTPPSTFAVIPSRDLGEGLGSWPPIGQDRSSCGCVTVESIIGAHGVYGDGGLTITKLVLTNNGTGVGCNCHGSMQQSLLRDNKIGLTSLEGGLQLTGNTIKGSEIGSWIWHLGGGSYSDNNFIDNKVGVQLTEFSSSVILQRNSFSRNGVGLTATASDFGGYGIAIVKDNLFSRNGDGIYLPLDEVIRVTTRSGGMSPSLTRVTASMPQVRKTSAETLAHATASPVSVWCALVPSTPG